MFVAALDLGTTGCRTFIFDLAGTIIASDYQEWESFYPVPSYVEQDANIWWESIKKINENQLMSFLVQDISKVYVKYSSLLPVINENGGRKNNKNSN